jgi:MFS family permease
LYGARRAGIKEHRYFFLSPKTTGIAMPWYRELNRYHWFVLIVAALGWLFDCLDQQLFLLARRPAMQELLAESPTDTPSQDEVRDYSGYATSIFLIGWALGGLGFGILGDRIGRAKTMLWTILIYSLCTGLSAFSRSFIDFAIFRFLTGLGVGGEFAVGVALVAEVMPERARPHALGLLQALSAVGNITAALVELSLSRLEGAGAFSDFVVGDTPVRAWRLMFVVGTLPALLAVVIRWRLKEPERWQQSVATGATRKVAGSYAELFGHPVWRRNALVGLALAFSGVVGLWGIGFFSFDLMRFLFKNHFDKAGLTPSEVTTQVGFWVAMTSILQNLGGFFGIWAYSRITHRIGRRPAFAISFLLAMASTAFVFWNIEARPTTIAGVTVFTDVLWMIPVMGFCQLALFGGYAIYFPELFPTHLRSTGTSFCYNVGRFVAAVGPAALVLLSSRVYAGPDIPEPLPWRYSAVTMCGVFLIGLVALPFAPETKDKPLPE